MADLPAAFIQPLKALPDGARVLLLGPGPHGPALARALFAAVDRTALKWTAVDSAPARLAGLATLNGQPTERVRGQAARLPFARHSFEGLVALEALFAIRPPWTVLAECHRVLTPAGVLALLEPATEGFFSMIRARLVGPGKRVYPREELVDRLRRGDFEVRVTETLPALDAYPRAVHLIAAAKVEHDAEPPPEWTTARELKARQKRKT